MSIVSKKSTSKKTGRNSRKAITKNDHALQEKLDKANRLLSKVINPEVLK